jgi:hypothetical protein
VDNFSGSLALNGVTYSFSPSGYRIDAYDQTGYTCISGNCLGNYTTSALWTITLDNPADRVGGYLSGHGDSLVLSQTDITFYDRVSDRHKSHQDHTDSTKQRTIRNNA